MSKSNNEGFAIFGMLVFLLLAITAKGFIFQYLWNKFLIGWAGLALPTIGFWHAWFIAILVSFVVTGFSTSKSSK